VERLAAEIGRRRIVFRLLKLLLVVAGLIAFVWFGANIALGPRTLFQHLQALGQTRTRARETEALLERARKTAQPLMDDVRKRWTPGGGSSSSDRQSASREIDGGAAPAEKISDAERLRLRRLLDPRHAAR
jgi:hypothetical protein